MAASAGKTRCLADRDEARRFEESLLGWLDVDSIIFMAPFAPTHVLLLLLVILIIFAPSRLGDIGGALGNSIRDFKRAIKGPESISDPTANAADGARVVEPGASPRHFDDLSGDSPETRKSLADDAVWGD